MRCREYSPDFDFSRVFDGRPASAYVGLELECCVVDPETGLGAPVDGPRGSVATLGRWAEMFGHATGPTTGDETTLANRHGGSVSLELGGALEYASPPSKRIVDAVHGARTTMSELSTAADSLGLAVITGGISPFTDGSSIRWIGKPRVDLMRRHFAALGAGGRWGSHVMGLSTAIQTTLDYHGPHDLARKAFVAVGASPVLAALFVNSPLTSGESTGYRSNRMRYWGAVDPVRCDFQDHVLRMGPYAGRDLVAALVERMRQLPEIYRPEDDDNTGHTTTVQNGGTHSLPGASDDHRWRSHLSQVWPQVRIRDTIELRAFDSPPWEALGAAPALWTGLLYDDESIADAVELVAELDIPDLASVSGRVARDGVHATVLSGGNRVPVGRIAEQFVGIAERGLQRRVADQLEPESVVDYLAPLRAVATTSVTFADQAQDRWNGDLGRSRRKFVDAYRVPRQ